MSPAVRHGITVVIDCPCCERLIDIEFFEAERPRRLANNVVYPGDTVDWDYAAADPPCECGVSMLVDPDDYSEAVIERCRSAL